jgi:hypothetical protein
MTAENCILGIISGAYDLVEVAGFVSDTEGAMVYPNDISDATLVQDTWNGLTWDTSVGPAKFSMGQVF